ncbi:MAG TPA: hypothetical protein VNU97_09650 [Rhizomicrobium sp.]|jgi:hypothetical protein|nr:hypothetical protein [Rhizomicrobium sp.]
MNTRALIAVLLLAGALAGCTSVVTRVAASLGLPKSGFATDALFPDGPVPAAAGCAARDCDSQALAQAPQFCTARGYQPGSDGYRRCLVSVAENLRAARR